MSEDKDKNVEVRIQKPNVTPEELQKNLDTLTEELNKADSDKNTLFNIIMNICNVTLMETMKLTESVAAIQKITRETLDIITPQLQQRQQGIGPGEPMSRVPVKLPRGNRSN